MAIEEILSSKVKPKAKLEKLSKAVLTGEIAVNELVNYYTESNKSEKGYLMEALEYASGEEPELVIPFIGFVIANINFEDSPRVRWETARVIANLAPELGDKQGKELEKSIDPLIKNTKDKGTVVRWSAALALTEIARNLDSSRGRLEKLFKKLVKVEENNGVRKHYEKYLKEVNDLS